MDTVFEFNSIGGSQNLESFTIKKLMGLAKKYACIIRADIFLKKENNADVKGNICSIRLSLPGPRMYASSDEHSFENAISNTINDLKNQLEKRKTKLHKSLN